MLQSADVRVRCSMLGVSSRMPTRSETSSRTSCIHCKVCVRSFLKDVSPHTPNQVHPVGLARPGQQLRHLHRFLAHPEKLHEAGVETDEMAGQPQIQQMAVQALYFQQDCADKMGPFRDFDSKARSIEVL